MKNIRARPKADALINLAKMQVMVEEIIKGSKEQQQADDLTDFEKHLLKNILNLAQAYQSTLKEFGLILELVDV
jgi:hypothetical protein